MNERAARDDRMPRETRGRSAARARSARSVLFLDTGSRLGGGQRSLLTLFEALDREHFEPVLACPPEGALAAGARDRGVTVHALGVRSRTARGAPGAAESPLDRLREPERWWRESTRLADAVAEEGIALLHANNTKAGVFAALLARRAGVPYVFHHRVEGSGRGVQWAASRAARVLCVSEAVRRGLGEVLAARAHVVPDGIDAAGMAARCEAARASSGEARPLTVAVVGRLSREKGQDVFLDAAARVAATHPEARFVLAGEAFLSEDDEYERALRARAGRPDLYGRVEFAGFREDVAAFLAGVDILVAPSRREGLGIAVLEGMACGLPVVASAVGGLRESVEDGKSGLLVPAEDAAALGAALGRLLEDAELRGRLGRAGRRRVSERFTREAMAQGVESVYREVLGGA